MFTYGDTGSLGDTHADSEGNHTLYLGLWQRGTQEGERSPEKAPNTVGGQCRLAVRGDPDVEEKN